MADTSLYWHDYETFGADPRRDAPVQFAGLRTDLDLNPIGEPLEIYCRPPLDRLPAPEACLITGITPQIAEQKGVFEAEFIAAIQRELSVPGTCSLGYNSLRFDDEVTRNTLYRNFYDPYEREWKNGNSRWDIIDTVRLTAALRPEGIEWPVDAQGRLSFRLENLTAANGITHVGAHDALVDVRATIALAKLIKTRQPKLYAYAFRHRGKHEAAELLKLGSFQPVLHVSEKYPAERGCLALVVALARHPTNQNEIAVFDLSADPAPLLDLDADAIRLRLFTRSADLPAGVERIPIKTVHLNRCPILVPCNTLRPQQAERWGIDLGRCQQHVQQLQAAAGVLQQKLRAVYTKPPQAAAETQDPDLMLYSGGFFSDSDKQIMARIRSLSPQQLAVFKPAFSDARLPEMLFRYRARNYPETLSSDETQRWRQFCQTRLTESNPNMFLTIAAYREKLLKLQSDTGCSDAQQTLLVALHEWGEILMDRANLKPDIGK